MYNLKKATGNKKGFTLVELIISMAVLAVIIVPVMSSFASIAAINVHTKQQHEVDAVMRIIEQNVIDDARNWSIPANDCTVDTHSSGADYSNYRFDVINKGQPTVTTGHQYIKDTYEYTVNIKRKKGAAFVNVQSFKVLVYEG